MSNGLAAIILNWNNALDTLDCVRSLRAGVSVPSLIVIVDNASTNDSCEVLHAALTGDESVLLVRNAENVGFARGVNVGIREALARGATHVLLINDDAVVDTDCLAEMLKVMDDPRAGAVGPRILYHSRPDTVWQAGGFFSRLKTGVVDREKNGKLSSDCPAQPVRVSFLSGCVVLIRVDVLRTVGLFDEGFFFYGEDADLCLRISRAGYHLLYIPSAQAWHKIEDIGRDRSSPFSLYHIARSRLLLLSKHFSRPYLVYGLLVHFGLYTPFRIWQVLTGGRNPASVRAWFRGSVDGIRAGW